MAVDATPDVQPPTRSVDYGLDAPGAVRALFLFAALGAAVSLARSLGLWNNHTPFAWLLHAITVIGAGFLFGGLGMVYASKVGKFRMRDRMLALANLAGHERVLDVGCGRGLLLVGAAKRLTTGAAVGIDIWSAVDLSGNSPQATVANVEAEGVADRVEVIDADARALPFPDASFDVVVSSTVLHNIPDAAGRERAVREMARVLRPGGRAVVSDIRHVQTYAAVFRDAGLESKVARSLGRGFLFPVFTMGALRPGHVVARNGDAPDRG